MKRPRILVADDHPLMLAGIRAVLTPHYEIAGTVTDGRALVETALLLKPDLIIVDITMPLLNGIDAAIQIKRSMPGIKLLFVTMHSSRAYLRAALEAGGTRYVVKSAIYEELLDAVLSVLRGGFYVSSSVSTEHLKRFQPPVPPPATPRLSMREREILRLIAKRRVAKEIAHVMNISVKTVAFHKEKIKKKLGLRTTAELTKYAVGQGLVQ